MTLQVKRGRKKNPNKKQKKSIALDPEILKKLEEHADTEGLSRSYVVNRAVEQYLQSLGLLPKRQIISILS